MNKLSEQQLQELSKIEHRIAMLDGKCEDQVYIILRRLCETYPNNYDLGTAIRSLTTSID